MDFHLKQHIENCLNKKFSTKHHFSWKSVSGGSINNAYKITSKNTAFFVKTNTKNVFKNGFKEEVLGLYFLQENNALTPEIILEGSFETSIYLVLSWIEEIEETPLFWKNFAEQLANLHKHENNLFGLNHSNYMGELLQTNTFHNNFSDFFIENRLKPQLQLAFNTGKLQKKHLQQFERLFQEIPALFPLEKPCAIHGDLWSGNFIASTHKKAIFIDPAVYFGHREIDLAMTTLFGGFSTKFYEHYQEFFPLEKGFHQRKNYYNLYPLLIHLNLFGNSYLKSIESIITKF